MNTLARFPASPRSAGFDDHGWVRGLGRARDYLKPFHDIAAMIGLIDRLPDLAHDIGRWRPSGASSNPLRARGRAESTRFRGFSTAFIR